MMSNNNPTPFEDAHGGQRSRYLTGLYQPVCVRILQNTRNSMSVNRLDGVIFIPIMPLILGIKKLVHFIVHTVSVCFHHPDDVSQPRDVSMVLRPNDRHILPGAAVVQAEMCRLAVPVVDEIVDVEMKERGRGKQTREHRLPCSIH